MDLPWVVKICMGHIKNLHTYVVVQMPSYNAQCVSISIRAGDMSLLMKIQQIMNYRGNYISISENKHHVWRSDVMNTFYASLSVDVCTQHNLLFISESLSI